MNPSQEVGDWSRRLRALLAERGCSQRSVERRLGWGAGYLSQLLKPGRPPELKARHLLAILDALDEPPAAFFSRVYDLAPRTAGGAETDPRNAPIDMEEVERRIVAAIQRELDRREAARQEKETAAGPGAPTGRDKGGKPRADHRPRGRRKKNGLDTTPR